MLITRLGIRECELKRVKKVPYENREKGLDRISLYIVENDALCAHESTMVICSKNEFRFVLVYAMRAFNSGHV